MTAIIGFADLLTRQSYGPLNPRQQHYASVISENGGDLDSLINDLLRLSVPLNRHGFEVGSVVDNCVTTLFERASKANVRLSSDIDPRLGTLSADYRKVKQILLNLISNAIRHTAAGGGA